MPCDGLTHCRRGPQPSKPTPKVVYGTKLIKPTNTHTHRDYKKKKCLLYSVSQREYDGDGSETSPIILSSRELMTSLDKEK